MTLGSYDVVVVGAGMLGASAARHLADGGCAVALVGEGEPADHRVHDGVFGRGVFRLQRKQQLEEVDQQVRR